MWLVVLLLGCDSEEQVLKSVPAEATKDLRDQALTIPEDSPLAQFFTKGPPALPTGPLGKLRPGMDEAEARRIADAIVLKVQRPPDVALEGGVSGFGGQLEGLDDVGFVVLVRDGRVLSLDVSAPLYQWQGVLEVAWGAPQSTRLPSGNPGARWENPAANLVVTFTNSGAGQAIVKWEPLDPAAVAPPSP